MAPMPLAPRSKSREAARQNAAFHAIGDPNRRRILEVLRQGEMPAGEVVARFDISFAAVSQHLGVLLDAGLVARRKEGRQRLYSIEPEALRLVHDWTEGFRDFWEGRLGRLSDYLDRDSGL